MVNPFEQGTHDEHRHTVDPLRYETDPQYRRGVVHQRGVEGGAYSGSTQHDWPCLPVVLAGLATAAAIVWPFVVRAVAG